jgi:hypothetical protein
MICLQVCFTKKLGQHNSKRWGGKRKEAPVEVAASSSKKNKLLPAGPSGYNPGPSSKGEEPSPATSVAVKVEKVQTPIAPTPLSKIIQRDEVYDTLIEHWILQCRRTCKELNLPACVIGRPRAPDGTHVIVFEDTKTSSADPECISLPKETTLLLSDLLSLGAFSVWMCNPVLFTNDMNGLFDAIYHFLEAHCKLEDLRRPDLHNVYHYYASKRGPTVYNRYK